MATEKTDKLKVKKEIPRSLGAFTLFIFKEIFRQKKWLLLPVWILLVAIVLLIVLGSGSAILPAIYIAF